MLGTLGRALISLVVPPLCAACHEPEPSGAALCRSCRAGLVPLAGPRCARCGAPAGSPAGSPASVRPDALAPRGCGECRGRELAFDHAWAAFAYTGVARSAVSALKSRGATGVAALMGRELALRAPPELLGGALVPVPAHRRRRRRHGFNQALEIARALGARTGLPVDDALVRCPRAAPQVGLARRERIANAAGSVRVRAAGAGAPGARRAPPDAVLVDDVFTTGATLDACAQALRQAGAGRIVALTFARALLG